ncbi:MAG: DUF4296 domain-containing protein [Saprospiraceae bacterium]|nr:DUF4296 domain-containing protein [Lewinella sp.]
MTRYFEIFIFSLAIVFAGCAREEVEPIPLATDKLIDVLIDVHVAEAMMDKLTAADQDTVGKVYYRMIFREHGISKEDFDKSMDILREDPERLNAIYEQILDKLNVLEAEARGIPDMSE